MGSCLSRGRTDLGFMDEERERQREYMWFWIGEWPLMVQALLVVYQLK